jgi:hypothetical protein
MTGEPPGQSHARPSRRQRFLAGYTWLVLKNVLGWVLILASFVAGPLVPGPGGIPLFLIGFALISFPGKRRLTARVLRGRPVRFARGPFVLVSLAVALVVPAVGIAVVRTRSPWLARPTARQPARPGGTVPRRGCRDLAPHPHIPAGAEPGAADRGEGPAAVPPLAPPPPDPTAAAPVAAPPRPRARQGGAAAEGRNPQVRS